MHLGSLYIILSQHFILGKNVIMGWVIPTQIQGRVEYIDELASTVFISL